MSGATSRAPSTLSGSEWLAYLDALRGSHGMRLRVTILDRDEKPVGSLTEPDVRVESGEVQLDTTAEVTRQLSLGLVDEAGIIDLTPNSPATAAVYADNFLAVEYGTWVPALAAWVDAPAFWGPVTKVERTGVRVGIEASGKDMLARPPFVLWRTMTLGRGVLVTDAITRIMGGLGEKRFALGTLKAKLPKPMSIGPRDSVWDAVQTLAKSADRHLFYDGAGRLTLAQDAPAALYEFEVGRDVIDEPAVTFDAVTDTRNVVEVLGPKPSGKDAPAIRGVAYAEAAHPLSAQSLARNGKPRYMLYSEQATNIKRQPDALKRAKSLLRIKLAAQVDASFAVLPVPVVNEFDLCALTTPSYRVEFQLRRATIPLTPDAPMAVGANRSVTDLRTVARSAEVARFEAWAS
jgi:hypothetical protein